MDRFVFILLFLVSLTHPLAAEDTFILEDRKRLIRVEARIDALEVKVVESGRTLQKQIDHLQRQIDHLQKQIDDLKADTQRQIADLKGYMNRQIGEVKTFMLWGFGVLFSLMGILMGMVLWDRKTTLTPVVKKEKEIEEREYLIERALKEIAKRDPNVEEALIHVGLMKSV